jgi:ParB/RepB/Spo0J family partition protein
MSRRKTVQTTPAPDPIIAMLPKPTKAAVALDLIDCSPFNKRTFREDDPKNQELTDNIRALGMILEPVLLRRVEERYCLIAGERRVRCGRKAGLLETDALIFEDIDEKTANLLTFVENFHRSDLHFLEEAACVEDLLASGCSQEKIAAQIGKPIKWVALRANLTNLSPGWRDVAQDQDYAVRFWSPSHLEVIALLSQPAQEELLSTYGYLLDSEPSVAQLRQIVAEKTLQLARAPWRLDDETLCPEAGACSSCPLRSSVRPTLFEDLELLASKDSNDRCLHPTCWRRKLQAHLTRRETELRQDHPALVLLTSTGNRSAGAIPLWSIQPAKKNQAGAVPGLLVDGADLGKVQWVFLPKPAQPEGEVAAAHPGPRNAAPEPAERGKSSLAERKAQKHRQRQQLATEMIAAAVAESERVPPLATVLALAYVFGTQQAHSSGSYVHDPELFEAYPEVSGPHPLWTIAGDLADREADLDPLGSRVWQRVRPVLLKRLNNTGTPEDIVRAWQEATKVAALLGIDSDQPLVEATLRLPDPRSWAAEEAALNRAAAAAVLRDQYPVPEETEEAEGQAA